MEDKGVEQYWNNKLWRASKVDLGLLGQTCMMHSQPRVQMIYDLGPL